MTNTKIPQQNLQALVDIAQKVNEIKFGQITFTTRVHNKKITDITFQEFRRIRYPEFDNKEDK
jgi:hypothetical protein